MCFESASEFVEMKHAQAAALALLEPLLQQLRALPGLIERTPGSFYFKGKAYLHFHEDPAGQFADAKLAHQGFERRKVGTRAEQAALLEQVRASLASRR